MPYTYEYPHPAVTVDVVLFSVASGGHRVLLIRRGEPPYQGAWAFPGGFVNIDEDLEAAAHRELEEETGVTGVELCQFHAFGAPDRDPRERIISIAHYGVVDAERVPLQAGTDAAEAAWFSLDDLPELAFDHADMLARALERAGAEIGLNR